jgi:hypothetical protein
MWGDTRTASPSHCYHPTPLEPRDENFQGTWVHVLELQLFSHILRAQLVNIFLQQGFTIGKANRNQKEVLSKKIYLISTPNDGNGPPPEGPLADAPSDAAITQQRTGSRPESERTARSNIGGRGVTAPLEKIQIKGRSHRTNAKHSKLALHTNYPFTA